MILRKNDEIKLIYNNGSFILYCKNIFIISLLEYNT